MAEIDGKTSEKSSGNTEKAEDNSEKNSGKNHGKMTQTEEKNTETMAEQNSGNAEKNSETMVGEIAETAERNDGKMAELNNENAEKSSEKNVSLRPDNKNGTGRDEKGRLLPGTVANPLGRPKRADERAIIAAMDKALPPDKLSEALQDALTWAYEYKSPKLILAIAQFVVAYQIGQPVQRSVSASGKLESILSRLSAMDEGEFDAVERAIRIPVDTESE